MDDTRKSLKTPLLAPSLSAGTSSLTAVRSLASHPSTPSSLGASQRSPIFASAFCPPPPPFSSFPAVHQQRQPPQHQRFHPPRPPPPPPLPAAPAATKHQSAGRPKSPPPNQTGGPWIGGGGGGGGGIGTGSVLARKKKGLSVRTWVRINAAGKAELLELDKATIMRTCLIPARDLRLLDPLFVYPSTILGREKAIVVNLEPIRALITADEVLFLETSEWNVRQFVTELRRRLLMEAIPASGPAMEGGASVAAASTGGPRTMNMPSGFSSASTSATQSPKPGDPLLGGWRTAEGGAEFTVPAIGWGAEGLVTGDGETPFAARTGVMTDSDTMVGVSSSGVDDLPFEFRALELALELACSLLEGQATELQKEAYPAMDELAKKISTLNLEHVRRLKSRLDALTRRVQRVRDEIEQLMDDDKDMKEMYLTEKKLREEESVRSSSGDRRRRVSDTTPWKCALEADEVRNNEEVRLGDHISVAETFSSPSLRGQSGLRDGDDGGASFVPLVSARDDVDSHQFDQDVDLKPGSHVKLKAGDPSQLNHLYAEAEESISASSSSSSSALDTEELEMLLEAYFIQCESTLQKLASMKEYIEDTEDYINIQLDNTRNTLILFELLLTSLTFVFTIYGVVAGIFGMNIPIGLETNRHAFKWVLLITGFVGFIIFGCLMGYFRYKRLLPLP